MKLYGVTQHAIDRAVERLEQPRKQAQHYLNDLMQNAVYTGTTGTGRVFDHYASRTRIILDREKDKIVTVYSMDSVKGEVLKPAQPSGILSNVIKTTVERELRKATTIFRRTYRQHTLKLADLNLEIAESFRNKVRCKHPGTQTLIQTSIDELQTQVDAITAAMQAQETEYAEIEREAQAYLGAESVMS